MPDETDVRAVDTLSLEISTWTIPPFLDDEGIHIAPLEMPGGGAAIVRLRDAVSGATGDAVGVRF